MRNTRDTVGTFRWRRQARWIGTHLRQTGRIGRHAANVASGSPVKRTVIAGLGLILVALLGVVAAAGFGTATAESRILAGRPVPADQVPVIQAAALSCPTLSPARLAGQLMFASGFNPSVQSGSGRAGVAGLTTAMWDRWKPSPQAHRSDVKANIIALAHAMCDFVGQVRQANVGGDSWRLALGAYHSGMDAVRTAKGVPAAAGTYVDTVVRLAAWYATRPEFSGASSTPTPSPSATGPGGGPAAPRAVPNEYLALVLSAGRTCPQMPPARIAAHLMAASAFNPNLLGASGAQGIAGFTPQMWASYALRPTATSPWDPMAAIPALGRAMCALLAEMSGVAPNPYPLAIAAFVWGPEAVKQARGVPAAAGLQAYVTLVQRYAEYYGGDPRLARPGASASASPTGADRASPKPAKVGNTSSGSTPRPSATPKREWQTRVVTATAVLTPGQAWSTDRLKFILRADGEVALTDRGRTVWRAGTAGKGGIKLVFQADGNLALYNSAGQAIWTTRTEQNDGAILVLQADGNVTISINGRFLWHTGSQD
ncbi:hypothetical protein [Micromonospora sp. NPDC050200]|uniref:hypothetical protein n=1 Tax=Micromonospora sp. NPDC050200 TaxID=3155664 RepID=UPI0033EA6878